MEKIIKTRGRMRVFSKIDIKKLAMIVIDMQNCWCAPGGVLEVPKARDIVPNINRLAQTCRKYDIPIFWVRQVQRLDGKDWRLLGEGFSSPDRRRKVLEQLRKGSYGARFWKKLDIQPRDYEIEKCRYSALIPGSSNLERHLRSLEKDSLIITGVRTNICPESTARDAAMLDFKVLFVGDGTAASSEEEHQASLDTLAQSFADVVTTDELVTQITQQHCN